MEVNIVPVRGVPTEVARLPATEGPAKLQVVLVPGNPGSVLFFKTFLTHAHRLLGGQADIIGVTHAGHAGAATDHGGKLWSLSEQIDHKLDFLREHVLLPGRPPVVLLGHSIGAYMVLTGLRRLEKELQQRPDGGAALPRVLKVVAIFPFLETDWRLPRQRRLRSAARMYNVMGLVALTLKALPRVLLRSTIRFLAKDKADGHAVDTAVSLLTRHSVRNNFFLALHEFRDLSRPFDHGTLRAYGDRLMLLGCPGDTWLSREQFEHAAAQAPEAQCSWHLDVGHGFCVSARQSVKMAEFVRDVCETVLEQEGVAAVPLVVSMPDVTVDVDVGAAWAGASVSSSGAASPAGSGSVVCSRCGSSSSVDTSVAVSASASTVALCSCGSGAVAGDGVDAAFQGEEAAMACGGGAGWQVAQRGGPGSVLGEGLEAEGGEARWDCQQREEVRRAVEGALLADQQHQQRRQDPAVLVLA